MVAQPFRAAAFTRPVIQHTTPGKPERRHGVTLAIAAVVNAEQVAVATITWARSPAEETVLRRSLERLATNGLPVAIADRGERPAFTAFLERLPGVVVSVPATRGLVAQVQASLASAVTFDRPFTLYVEPDKELFFADAMADFVRRAPDARDIGVVLASRSDEAFTTFPPMQRYTEGIVNHLCAELLGPAGDYAYGPFLIARMLLPAIAALDPALGWGWRPAAFAAAQAAGLRLVHLTGDYTCPPDQRSEGDDERVHRLRQLSENIRGLIAVSDRTAAHTR